MEWNERSGGGGWLSSLPGTPCFLFDMYEERGMRCAVWSAKCECEVKVVVGPPPDSTNMCTLTRWSSLQRSVLTYAMEHHRW